MAVRVGSVFAVLLSTAGLTAQPPGSQAPAPPVPLLPPEIPAVGPTIPPADLPPAPPAAPPVMPAAAFGVAVRASMTPVAPPLAGPRFPLTIPPTAKAKDLLPTPPKAVAAGPVLTDDLSKVPEVTFGEQPAKDVDVAKRTEATAHQLAKIAHLNAAKTDAFMAALIDHRPDLQGVPFVMGDDCRSAGERARQFAGAVALVQQARGGGAGIPNAAFVVLADGSQTPVPTPALPAAGPSGFWTQFAALCDQADANRPRADKVVAEHATLARLAAVTQMLAAEPAESRAGLVKYLTGVAHVEATRHLARMAIFAAEDDVRLAAIDALKVRREKDYTDILVNGLRYPWPAVARRAADAVARLDRKDLVPELVAVLGEADPRLPKTGPKGATVRELVKVNHHRNCMLCHPAGQPGSVPDTAITAEVPVQGQALPTPAQGYNRSSPDLMVRVDVTYLRGDFSAMLTVADAHPWPDQQRFDFVVRERSLSAAEADAVEAKLAVTEPGVLSPYHKAALAALREITGKDTAPTAAAWRELLAR